jgi:hypothetical protein
VDGVDVTITLGRSFDAVAAAAETTTVAPGASTTEGE